MGTPCEDVDRAARDVIAAAGYGDYFVHRTGHGIGMEEHEDPYIVEGNRRPLETGHAFSIEPGIYLPGRAGRAQRRRSRPDQRLTGSGRRHVPSGARYGSANRQNG